MKIIENSIIPFKGFISVNLFGVLFVRKEEWNKIDDDGKKDVINHALINLAQMKELWYVGFYIIYFLEWIYRLIFHTKTAYRGISFEREAYMHDADWNYLFKRERFAQWKN